MNLTEPPRVRRPDARRRADLRTALVESAADDIRDKQPRTWMPVLAATATVATVAAAAIAVPRLAPADPAPADRSGPATTAPSPSKSTPATRPAPTAPAPPTRPGPPAVSTDRGPATVAEVRAMVRACVSRIDSSQMFRPADATTAVIEWGRWIAMPSTEVLTDARNKHPGRALAASIVRRDGWARALCVDGVMLSSAQIAQSAEVKLLVPTRAYPVDGGCAAPFNERRGGRWLLQTLCTYTVYDQARLDMRLVWNGGAGAWHTAVGGRGFGLVELFATGAGPKRTNVRLEVRAIDRDGSVFYRVGGSVEVPIGSVTR